ncbi:MAG: hypothetical protein IPK83_15470 [Planctomycetes bacterium]|nr:hypothetical protein [Planctomycetota bacterium]
MGDAIGGVSWGDAGFSFATTDAQLTLNSPWLYNIANTVAFTRAWTANTNAEMGIVQTKAMDREMGYGDRVVGRERGNTSASVFTNKGDCGGFGDARNYGVPCVSGWPYQLMNYDWDPGTGKPAGEATGTKLIAWGTPYGWLASSSFDLFDYSGKADGRGDRSYATFIVLGPKARYDAAALAWNQPGDVAMAVAEVEALAAATIDGVTKGSVSTLLPRGPGATEMKTVANGYNDTYAAFFLDASANSSAFTFTPAVGMPVDRPIFVIRGYSAPNLPKVSMNGGLLTVNSGDATSGAFVSMNETSKELWITINSTVSAATALSIEP